MKKNSAYIAIFCLLLLSLLVFVFYGSQFIAPENFSESIHGTPQNALHWVDLKNMNLPLITKEKQRKFTGIYLHRYFFPWQFNSPKELLALKEININKIHYYHYAPGYGINHLPNSKAWIETIARNMDITHFPNENSKVITVENTNMRDLPTEEPLFGDFHQAGEGYPFDYLQVTSVSANTPALVIQRTRDGAWSFILTPTVDGWVPTTTLALVDKHFMHRWKTKKYVTLTKNNQSIIDNQGVMRFIANSGQIFPNEDGFILIAASTANRHAVIKREKINSTVFSSWPLLPTQKNIADVMNKMLGVKYGWGGIAGNSDCSGTVMHLFSAFGLWLPRHSELQATVGHVISLHHKTNAEKEKIIIREGVPFLTLLSMPGHIVVYIGEHQGNIVIFQTAWGLHTRNWAGEKGRAIIGNTIISPIDLGKYDINVQKTWLDEITAMTVL